MDRTGLAQPQPQQGVQPGMQNEAPQNARQLGTLAEAIDSLAANPPGLDTQVSERRLANGLRVFVLEDHRAPVIAHSLWYRAGSIDETSGVTGIAHVLEHLMFNSTVRYGPGEYDRQMRALGAYTNAHTWTDYTAYTVEAPASRLSEVMALEAERMTDLLISDAEFAREIRVVMEERRQSLDDDPTGLLYEGLYATAFHASPQRWPIIGWMSDLQTMRADDARDWYKRWYRPDNATLVVAGDVDPEAVFALAERHYGGIQQPLANAAVVDVVAGTDKSTVEARAASVSASVAASASAVPLRRAQEEPPQRGARRIETLAHTPAALVAIGFKTPRLVDPHTDDDVHALAVLAELLDWGRVLETALVRRRRLADETWAFYDYLLRTPGLFIVGAACAQDVAPERVERALRAAITDIARDGVDEASLRRVRTQLLSARLYRSDSVFEQADELGRLATLGFSGALRAIDAKLVAVTAEQIKSVAQRYFSDQTMTVAILLPDDAQQSEDSDEGDSDENSDDSDGDRQVGNGGEGVHDVEVSNDV
jgi:zinc protease